MGNPVYRVARCVRTACAFIAGELLVCAMLIAALLFRLSTREHSEKK
jgi:hypothetical protein